jgi:hypothetical protein
MLVEKNQACLVLFNQQLELIPLLENGTMLLNDCCWLADVSKALDVPTIVIEHRKLGRSSEALKGIADHARYFEKVHFDCLAHEEIRDAIEKTGKRDFILAGAETHVCVLQSALGFKRAGKNVFVLADSTSSRNRDDHRAGLQRLAQEQVPLLTREMYFFELIRHSEYPNYLDLAMRFLDGRYIR